MLFCELSLFLYIWLDTITSIPVEVTHILLYSSGDAC